MQPSTQIPRLIKHTLPGTTPDLDSPLSNPTGQLDNNTIFQHAVDKNQLALAHSRW